jgi:hypothetical protein
VLCDDSVAVDAETPTVQEIHQVAVHILCGAVDRVVAETLASAHRGGVSGVA